MPPIDTNAISKEDKDGAAKSYGRKDSSRGWLENLVSPRGQGRSTVVPIIPDEKE